MHGAERSLFLCNNLALRGTSVGEEYVTRLSPLIQGLQLVLLVNVLLLAARKSVFHPELASSLDQDVGWLHWHC